MPKKRFTPEQIIGLLRQAEVELAQERTVGEVCRTIGVSEQTYRDELLNGETFYTLKEGIVLIERWRQHDNIIRPHSALGDRPPAPEAILPCSGEPTYASPRRVQRGASHGPSLT